LDNAPTNADATENEQNNAPAEKRESEEEYPDFIG